MKWTQAEDEAMLSQYGSVPLKTLAASLNRTVKAVKKRYHTIKPVKKPKREPYLRWTAEDKQIMAMLYPNHTAAHVAKVLGRPRGSVLQMAQTMKLVALRPSLQIPDPIGTEKLVKGVWMRKVANTGGKGIKNWIPAARAEWEKLNGPIPPGFFARPKNPSLRPAPDNLELVTHSEHLAELRKVTSEYPPELRELISLKGQITRTVRRMAQEA